MHTTVHGFIAITSSEINFRISILIYRILLAPKYLDILQLAINGDV